MSEPDHLHEAPISRDEHAGDALSAEQGEPAQRTSHIGKNLTWLMLSQVATWALSPIMIVLIPRFLGVDDYGTWAFISAYVGFFALAAGLGMSPLMTREVARNHSIVGLYVYNAVVMKLVLVTVFSALALTLAVILDYSNQTLVLIAIGCGGMYFTSINEMLAPALHGLERMGKASFWAVVTVYVTGIGGIIILSAGVDLVGFLVFMSLVSAIPVIGNGMALWPMVRPHRRLDRSVWKALVTGGFPLFLLLVFNQIYMTVDVPILNRIAGETTVGWYSLAWRWAGIPIFVVSAVMAAHYPAMSAHGAGKDDSEFARLVNSAIRLTLLLAVPSAIGLAVVAGDMIDLFYDPEFANAAGPTQILALHIPIASMDTILATALITSNRLNRYLVVAGVAAVLNPLVTTVAIHATMDAYDNGAIGAALVTLATEAFVMGGALLLRNKGVMDRQTTLWCLRCAIAGLSIFAVLAIPGAPLLVQVLLGMAIYTVASLALRTISVGMIRQVGNQVFAAVGSVRARRSARSVVRSMQSPDSSTTSSSRKAVTIPITTVDRLLATADPLVGDCPPILLLTT